MVLHKIGERTMDIEIKDYLVEVKTHHNMLLELSKSYCDSPQLVELQKKI